MVPPSTPFEYENSWVQSTCHEIEASPPSGSIFPAGDWFDNFFVQGSSPGWSESPEQLPGVETESESILIPPYSIPCLSGIKCEGSIYSESECSTPVLGRRTLPASLEYPTQFPNPSWTPEEFPIDLFSGERNHQVEIQGRHFCAECKRSFDNAQCLEAHAKTQNHQAYICTEQRCGKRYRRRDTLVRHKAVHKSSERHICRVCQRNRDKKVFARKDHLLQHMRSRHPYDMFQLRDRKSSGIVCNIPPYFNSINTDILQVEISLEQSQEQGYTPANANTKLRQNREVRDITSALNSILGEHDPAIQMMVQDPETKAKLARSLARLALMQPEKLSEQTKEQLQILEPCSSDEESP